MSQARELHVSAWSGSASPPIPAGAARHSAAGTAGRPLDPATLGTMENRFGCDLSRVRVHTDSRAAAAVGAAAYTQGTTITFAPGRYAPRTTEGQRLLAHELTHVMQQTRSGTVSGEPGPWAEREAQENAGAIAAGRAPRVAHAVRPGAIQCQSELNEKAKAILAAARDEKANPEDRAVAAVRQIYRTYYPEHTGKVASVEYDDAKAGTGVQVEQKFAAGSKPRRARE
jgi:hypothetical protein